MAARCAAITRGGSRCPSPVVAGSTFCWTHDPQLDGARREAARKGGKARSAKARAAKQIPDALTPDELAGWLSALFKRVLVGEIDPKVGHSCATIARTLLEARAAAEQPRVDELAEQVELLRSLIERQQRGAA
jgi:hypothetical protein